MRGKSYGYGSYRGRGGTSAFLKGVIAVLVIVLILAVAAFFFLQRYMVYNDDGTSYLDLPFLREEAPAQPLPPVVTPSAAPLVTPEPQPTPTPRPELILPVSLPEEALYDGTAAELVKEGGGTAALFDMKGDNGTLAWVSDQELAITARASSADTAVNGAMKAEAEDDGLYRIARVSCFRDDLLFNVDTTLAVTTKSGYRWLDSDRLHWVWPGDERVQAYVTELCLELSGLGFDEILLDNAGFPTQGKLSYIDYGDTQFQAVISDFYSHLAASLEGTGVALSVVYDPGTAALSGQSEAGIEAAGMTAVTRNEDGKLVWP